MVFILGWLSFALICAAIGSKKGEIVSGFLAGALFGPLGLLFTLGSSGNRKPCPFCKTQVHKEATICPACRSELFAATNSCVKKSFIWSKATEEEKWFFVAKRVAFVIFMIFVVLVFYVRIG